MERGSLIWSDDTEVVEDFWNFSRIMLFGNIIKLTKQRKIGNLTEENILLCNIKTRNTYLHKYFCNAHKGLGLIIIHKKRTWY